MADTTEDPIDRVGSNIRVLLNWLVGKPGRYLTGWLMILLPLLTWAAALWPAAMGADSIDTWNQAATGRIVNWHPPVYTLAQQLAFQIVQSPWPLILLQCLVMAWAVRRLLDLAVDLGLNLFIAYGFGAAVAVLPPLGAFTSHLIKDVPYTIGFLLVIGFVGRGVLERCGFVEFESRPVPRELILFAGLLTMLLARVNGRVAFAIAIVAVLWAAPRRWVTAGVATGAVVAYIVIGSLIYPALGYMDPPNHVRGGLYVFDLGALYQVDAEQIPTDARDDLELYATAEEWREGFNCHWSGNQFHERFNENREVDLDDLSESWRSALLSNPLHFVGNHLCAASPAWNPFPSPEELANQQTVWNGVAPNPQGIEAKPLSDHLDVAARRFMDSFGINTPSQILFWRAPTWMYMLAGLLVIASIRTKRWALLWIYLPFAAQAASVIAIYGPHYRYMAPAWIGAVMLLPMGGRLVFQPRRDSELPSATVSTQEIGSRQ